MMGMHCLLLKEKKHSKWPNILRMTEFMLYLQLLYHHLWHQQVEKCHCQAAECGTVYYQTYGVHIWHNSGELCDPPKHLWDNLKYLRNLAWLGSYQRSTLTKTKKLNCRKDMPHGFTAHILPVFFMHIQKLKRGLLLVAWLLMHVFLVKRFNLWIDDEYSHQLIST